MTETLDPTPMVSKSGGARHQREQDCWVYCRFEPREGYETDLSAYPVHYPTELESE